MRQFDGTLFLEGRVARILTVVALLVILGSTLRSDPRQVAQAAAAVWTCVVCGEEAATDVLLNLLLFVPLGLGLRGMAVRWPTAITTIFLVTVGIESVQTFFLVGRYGSLSDVVANTLGGLFGIWLLPRLGLLSAPTRSTARVLATTLLLASATTWLTTGFGLRPEWSTDSPWFGQIVRAETESTAMRSAVRAVSLDGMAIPNDSIAPAPVFHANFALSLLWTRTEALSPSQELLLVRLVDSEGDPQLTLARRGSHLRASTRVSAMRYRVREPVWQFTEMLGLPADSARALEWRWEGDHVEFSAGGISSGNPASTQSIPISIGLGWVFVHPFAASIGAHAIWWTALWLAFWYLPIGWFLGWLPFGWRVAGVTASLMTFLGASQLTGLPVRTAEVWWVLIHLAVGIGLATSASRKRQDAAA